jgi:hypothetical protein
VQTADGRDVAAWLDDRKATSPYLRPPARSAGACGDGEGAKVYSGENPFAPATFNLTKQGELLMTTELMKNVTF